MFWGSLSGRAARVILGAAMLVAITAGDAVAAEVRFVHAVPGADKAQLTVQGRPVGAPVGFGAAGEYARTASGSVRLAVEPPGGGRPLANDEQELGKGRYTIVATRSGEELQLRAYRDGKGKGGQAQLRAIHAATELGRADFRADGKTLADNLRPGVASPYKQVEPGMYALSVSRAGGGGGALVAKQGVSVTAGTSTTAVVLGSGGEPTRMLVLTDGVDAPSQAPATGLGGLSGGPPWAAALLAALLAGLMGGTAHRIATRRSDA